MITCLTHRYSESGDCMDCGVALAEHLQGDTLVTRKLTTGCDIGLIYSPTTGHTAYIVGEHDSNKRCTEIGGMATVHDYMKMRGTPTL